MLNHAFDSVSNARIPPLTLSAIDTPEESALMTTGSDFLDHVPVMPATVFGLEMLLQERNIDLQVASDIVLSDVGATIHTLRLVRREYETATERPNRMCECIAGLDAALWFETISTRISTGGREHAATTEIWKHCRSVAQCARFVAESMDDVSPDDAYLVGLLHGIKAIPAALDWSEDQWCRAMSMMEETLPSFVLAAMRDDDHVAGSSVWQFILTAAHRLSASLVDSYEPVLGNMSSMVIAQNSVVVYR